MARGAIAQEKTNAVETPKPEAPQIDFNTLENAVVSADTVKHTRAGRSNYGTYPEAINETYKLNNAREVVIPAATVASFCNMLRAAAKTVNLGVRRTVTPAGDGMVRVNYRGAELIKRKPKAE